MKYSFTYILLFILIGCGRVPTDNKSYSYYLDLLPRQAYTFSERRTIDELNKINRDNNEKNIKIKHNRELKNSYKQ